MTVPVVQLQGNHVFRRQVSNLKTLDFRIVTVNVLTSIDHGKSLPVFSSPFVTSTSPFSNKDASSASVFTQSPFSPVFIAK
ncbi:hypothetical protein ON010_g11846 [Phytophthora cinnamomi]|nr:hypothetical protein ON010_g11846 [Phytophthora cinnamomi]